MKLTLLIFLLMPLSLYAIAFNCGKGMARVSSILDAHPFVIENHLGTWEYDNREMMRTQHLSHLTEVNAAIVAIQNAHWRFKKVQPSPRHLYQFLDDYERWMAQFPD